MTHRLRRAVSGFPQAGFAVALVASLCLAACTDTAELDAFEACRTGTVSEPCFAYFNRFPTGAHVSDVDDRLFDLLKTSFDGLETYKKELQHGRHRDNIPAARAAIWSQAIAKYQTTVPLDRKAATGRAAIVRLLEALKHSETHIIYVSYYGSTDFDGKHGHPNRSLLHKAYPEKQFVEPGYLNDMFAVTMPNQLWEAVMTESLTSMLAKPMGEMLVEFRRLEPNAPPPRKAPVLVEVQYVWFLAPTVYLLENSNQAYYGVGLDWTLSITYPQTPTLQPDVFRDRSLPTLPKLETTTLEYRKSPETRIAWRGAQVRLGGKMEASRVQKSESSLYTEIEGATLDDFAAQLGKIAGVAEAK